MAEGGSPPPPPPGGVGEGRRSSGEASGGARIAAAFAGHGRRAALMPYLMAGFPDRVTAGRVAEACVDAGADLIELGVPFSDPLADGPAIHAAATRALAAGATIDDALGLCDGIADTTPVVLMAYANAVLARGLERFCDEAAAAGASGLIVPDLPYEEAGEARSACDDAGLALVPLVAPGTTGERLRRIVADARGFVYAVSVAGTTGERERLPPEAEAALARIRAVGSLPVAIGFGISTERQARRAAELADGVIVGSRIVRAADEGGADAVAEVVASLARALA